MYTRTLGCTIIYSLRSFSSLSLILFLNLVLLFHHITINRTANHHRLHGSASTVLTATGQVNGR